VLEWKDIGSLGRTGRGDKEEVSASMSKSSWSEWSSDWGWMRSQTRAYGSGLKAGQGLVTLQCRSTTDHLTRKTKQTRLFIDRTKQLHFHKPWSSWGTSTTLISVDGTTLRA